MLSGLFERKRGRLRRVVVYSRRNEGVHDWGNTQNAAIMMSWVFYDQDNTQNTVIMMRWVFFGCGNTQSTAIIMCWVFFGCDNTQNAVIIMRWVFSGCDNTQNTAIMMLWVFFGYGNTQNTAIMMRWVFSKLATIPGGLFERKRGRSQRAPAYSREFMTVLSRPLPRLKRINSIYHKTITKTGQPYQLSCTCSSIIIFVYTTYCFCLSSFTAEAHCPLHFFNHFICFFVCSIASTI